MRVDYDLKHLVNHLWNYLFGPFTWLSEVGVGVDFNEPHSEVFIDHKVEAKQFKVVSPSVWIDLVLDREKAVYNKVFHSGHNVFVYVHMDFALA